MRRNRNVTRDNDVGQHHKEIQWTLGEEIFNVFHSVTELEDWILFAPTSVDFHSSKKSIGSGWIELDVEKEETKTTLSITKKKRYII